MAAVDGPCWGRGPLTGQQAGQLALTAARGFQRDRERSQGQNRHLSLPPPSSSQSKRQVSQIQGQGTQGQLGTRCVGPIPGLPSGPTALPPGTFRRQRFGAKGQRSSFRPAPFCLSTHVPYNSPGRRTLSPPASVTRCQARPASGCTGEPAAQSSRRGEERPSLCPPPFKPTHPQSLPPRSF